jgi:inner membrane protein
MASVGHIAVGLAAARVYHNRGVPHGSSVVWWSALSLSPDADVIGFALGVEYADPWGHRGATHSLVSAMAVGLAIGLTARWFKRPAGRIALVASVVLASHAILDTMTDGGLGCALFWPVSFVRYFALWRPIPVAPIGFDFLSPYGGIVALKELVLFSPLLFYALRRSTPPRPVGGGFFLALWLISGWLVTSGDSVRDAIVGFVLREDTAYTSGFSEEAFRTITSGKSEEDVRQLLGTPHEESWFYPPKDRPLQRAWAASASALPRECLAIRFQNEIVLTALDVDACRKLGIETGTSRRDVKRLLGSPREACWRYSWSPRNAFYYRVRAVCFLNAEVDIVLHRWTHFE